MSSGLYQSEKTLNTTPDEQFKSLDSSDEYWDQWHNELQAKIASGEHYQFVKASYERKNPGCNYEDYMQEMNKQTQTQHPPISDDPATGCRRERIGQIPQWQQRLAEAPGIPVEHWNSSEEDLIAAIKQNDKQTSSDSDADFVKSTNVTIKNIIGCVHELQGELDKLMDIYNEHYDRAKATFDEELIYKFDRIMDLYNSHCGLLDIKLVDKHRSKPKYVSKMTPEMVAKMRLSQPPSNLNNNNNDNNNDNIKQ